MADVRASTAQCPHMGSCPMFSLFNLSSALAVWKIRYCTADYTCCARYVRASLGHTVPLNLMPNGEFLKKTGSGGAR